MHQLDPDISVIIVTWNGKELLRRCLDCLSRQTFKEFEIIVVDNGSEDSTENYVQDHWPEVRFLRLGRNFGFAKANNRAVDMARGRWLAFLNNDTFVLPEWLEAMMKATKRWPGAVAFTSHQLMAADPRYLDGTGDEYFIFGAAKRRDYLKQERDVDRDEGPVFGLCGAASIIKKDIFLALGRFDEDFFCYFEDVDLSWRIRLAGHEICYVPGAIVRHIGSKTAGRRNPWTLYHSHRNQIWTIFKNIPLPLLFLTLPLHCCYTLYLIIRVYRSSELRMACIRGKIDAFKGLPRFFKKRKEVLSSRKATLSYLLNHLSIWP